MTNQSNTNAESKPEPDSAARTVEDRIDGFITLLRSYAREGQENRAALAALRSGLRGQVEHAPAMHSHVVPFLEKKPHQSDRWFYLVGALFAWHPAHRAGRSLGAAFRELKNQEGASASIEARFSALLASDERDLHLHLRQAIGMLKAHDVRLDWKLLLRDLALHRGWRHPERAVQMRWARHFYQS